MLPGASKLKFPLWVTSDLSRSVSPRILRSRPVVRLTLMGEKCDSRLTAVQKQYKYDDDKCVRQTPVFKTNGLVFVDRPPLGVCTKNSKTTDRTTKNKLLLGAEGPYHIISGQNLNLSIDDNAVPNTISIDRAAPAPPDNTIASVGEGQNASEDG